MTKQKILLQKALLALSVAYWICITVWIPPCSAFASRLQGHRTALHRSRSTLLQEKYIVCFDGTGNTPMKGVGINPRNNTSISNVLKLHLLAGGNPNNKNLPSNVPGQKSFYYTGVGTRSQLNIINSARFAIGLRGPRMAIKEAMDDLKIHYNPGEDEIYVFGFSRGAATARLFASKLAKQGIKLKSKITVRDPPIAFLGVWDTVADIGFLNLNRSRLPSSRALNENGVVAPIVQNALHLISLDDNRVLFFPTPMGQQSDKPVTEIRFPGTHSDVGGGFFDQGLSDGALTFMLRYASEDIGTGKNLRFLKPSQVPDSALIFTDKKSNKQVITNRRQIEVTPDFAAELHGIEKSPMNKGWWGRLFYTTRPVYNAKNDKRIPNSVILVHESVIQRLFARTDYYPEDLVGVKYKIVKDDGTILDQVYEGLDLVQEMKLVDILG